MKLLTVTLLILFAGMVACKKGSAPAPIAGTWYWAAQYYDNPAYTATPQSTGIEEILTFTTDGQYTQARNGIVVNDGSYQLFNAKNQVGQIISGVRFSNGRVSDSICYYEMFDNNDTLDFSSGLIGVAGSGARIYGRH